jgi:hypothetical protein
VVALEGHLLGQREIVLVRFAPVDEMNGVGDLARLRLDLYAVTQQAIHRLVVAVERAAVVVGFAVQHIERAANLRRRVSRAPVTRQESTMPLHVRVFPSAAGICCWFR